jgi:hypothetical protein
LSTNYPTSLDSYSTKNSGDTISEGHVNDLQDAVEAIEAKLGIKTNLCTTKGIDDADGDTMVQVEEDDSDEDMIRFDTAGTERFRIEDDGEGVKGTGCNICLIETGTYTGNGGVSQAISLSNSNLTPKVIMIVDRPGSEEDCHFWVWMDDSWGQYAFVIQKGGNSVNKFLDNRIIATAAGSFRVDDDGSDLDPNQNNEVYSYVVWG